MYVPVFLCSCVLDMAKNVDKQFVKCSCKKWKQRQHSCECFFRVVNSGSVNKEKMLDLLMIDVRFWKSHNVFCGNGTKSATALMEAQARCFMYEEESIEIWDSLWKKLTGDKDATYLILDPTTTSLDMREMEYVFGNEVITL